jgi:hypothetical protein
VVTTLQAVLLGMMISWTPSLVIMAILLRRAPLKAVEFDNEASNYKDAARLGRSN